MDRMSRKEQLGWILVMGVVAVAMFVDKFVL